MMGIAPSDLSHVTPRDDSTRIDFRDSVWCLPQPGAGPEGCGHRLEWGANAPPGRARTLGGGVPRHRESRRRVQKSAEKGLHSSSILPTVRAHSESLKK